MALSSEDIYQLVFEINQIAGNSLVNKIKKGFQKEVIFELYKEGLHFYMVLAIHTDLPSLHLSQKEKLFFFEPDAFTMLLRKYFQRRVFLEARVIEKERIVRFYFKNAPFLTAFLFSRGGNLLVSTSEEMILGSLLPIEKEKIIPEDNIFQKPQENKNLSSDLWVEKIGKNYEEKIQKLIKKFLVTKKEKEWKIQLKNLKNRIKKIEQDYQNCQKADQYFLWGNLILSFHSHRKEKGIKELITQDYEGNRVVIPLNSEKTILDNAELFFQRAKKLKKALPFLEERFLSTQNEIEELEAKIQHIQQVDLETLRKEIKEEKENILEKKYKNKILMYKDNQGFRILVGRNAKENDMICRIARPKDIWLHARDYPGSHVVIWNEGKNTPPEETIKKAAQLALLYSQAKKHGEGFVMVAPKKWVIKRKGMAEGEVSLLRYRSLWVKIEEKITLEKI